MLSEVRDFRSYKKKCFKIYRQKNIILNGFRRNENNSNETSTLAINEIILTSQQEQEKEGTRLQGNVNHPRNAKGEKDIKQNLWTTSLEKLVDTLTSGIYPFPKT